MKTRIALTSIIAGLLPLTAPAQTSVPPAVLPPQPALAPAPAAPAAPATPALPALRHLHREDEPRGPVTFLGVETSRVSRVLGEQLGLPRGFGVVVDYVVPESAAATAGLQQNDIIRMLNDQFVIDAEQLGVLVRSYPDGSSATLTIVRKGQEMKLTAKLQQKEQKSGHGAVGYDWNFDGFDRLEDLHLPDMSAVRESVERAKEEARRASDQARAAVRNMHIVTSDDGTVKASRADLGKALIVSSDDKGELRLEKTDGKKVLTAKDPSGKILFEGAIDTPEERAKLPVEVRTRLENFERQDLPPVPPNEQLAPRPPSLNDSANRRRLHAEQTALLGSGRSGWTRNTILL